MRRMGTVVNTTAVTDVAAWYAMSQTEVARRLGTNLGKGLDLSEASDRLLTYGPNRLPEGRKRGPLTRFFAQFNNILVDVLLAAGGASPHCRWSMTLMPRRNRPTPPRRDRSKNAPFQEAAPAL